GRYFGGDGARKQDQTQEYEPALRGDVEKAVRDISGEDRGGMRASPETDRQANNVAANDRRKKQGAEEPAEITLGAGREIEPRAGGVDDHLPFEDADGVNTEVQDENDHEAQGRNTREGGAERIQGKEMKEQSENSKSGQPAEDGDCPGSRGLMEMVRADHAPDFCVRAAILAKISSIFSASTKSRSLMPLTLWVTRSKVTLFQTLDHSGW